MLILILTSLFAFSAQALPTIEILNLKATGCELLEPEEPESGLENNEDDFCFEVPLEIEALAENRSIDKKRCTLTYDVKLSSGYKIDRLFVALKGDYLLSPKGSGRLTISHRVANNRSARATKFFTPSDDPSSSVGEITDFVGVLTNADLPEQYRQEGVTIPVTTSIYAEAVNYGSRVSLNKLTFSATTIPLKDEPKIPESTITENYR